MTREVALLRPAGLVLAVGFFVPLFLFPPIRRTLGEPGFTPSPSDSSPSETIELTPGDPATPPPVVDTATCPARHLHPILARFPDRPLARRPPGGSARRLPVGRSWGFSQAFHTDHGH